MIDTRYSIANLMRLLSHRHPPSCYLFDLPIHLERVRCVKMVIMLLPSMAMDYTELRILC